MLDLRLESLRTEFRHSGEDGAMQVAGVDGCRAGWVAVILDGGRVAGTLVAATLVAATLVAATLREIVDACPRARAIGVDMPMGLIEQGWREADRLAAARLGAHRSRLFMVPPRAAWATATYPEAVAVCRELTEPPAGFSKQAWGLKDKIGQAGELRARHPGRLFEVHPELAFAELNGGRPVAASKKTWNGQMTRRTLLAKAGLYLPDDLGPTGMVGVDDILDAAAVAWSAARIAAGTAACLPSPAQPGPDGQPIAIWY